MNSPESTPIPYHRVSELVPPEWLPDLPQPKVWLRAYRTTGVPQRSDRIGENYELPAPEKVLMHFRHGGFTGPPALTIEVREGNIVRTMAPAGRQFADDVYVFFLTPLLREDEASAVEARHRIDVAAGMLAASVSPNLVYETIFELCELVREDRGYVRSNSLRAPGAFPPPDLARLERLRDTAKAIRAAKNELRTRVEFSLRWFQGGLAEFDVDAFVKLWVALDSLTLDRSASTKPLSRLLGVAYGKTESWASSTLKIEKLAQKRGLILHGGRLPAIAADLLRYLAALYEDSLAAKLGLPFERRAEAILQGSPYLQSL